MYRVAAGYCFRWLVGKCGGGAGEVGDACQQSGLGTIEIVCSRLRWREIVVQHALIGV